MRRKRTEREAAIERACVDRAKALGWATRKMNGLGFRSWPDRLFIPPRGSSAWPFWVEFKRPGEAPTEEQARMHQDLRARGQEVLVFDNRASFFEHIERIAHD